MKKIFRLDPKGGERPTPYSIHPNHDQLAVHKGGKIETLGFSDEDSALHSVWIIEGEPNGVTFKIKETADE